MLMLEELLFRYAVLTIHGIHRMKVDVETLLQAQRYACIAFGCNPSPSAELPVDQGLQRCSYHLKSTHSSEEINLNLRCHALEVGRCGFLNHCAPRHLGALTRRACAWQVLGDGDKERQMGEQGNGGTGQ